MDTELLRIPKPPAPKGSRRTVDQDAQCVSCGMFLLDTAWFPDPLGRPVCEICFNRGFQAEALRESDDEGQATVAHPDRPAPSRIYSERRAEREEVKRQEAQRSQARYDPKAGIGAITNRAPNSTVRVAVPLTLLRMTEKPEPAPAKPESPRISQSRLNLPTYTWWDEYGRALVLFSTAVGLAYLAHWITQQM